MNLLEKCEIIALSDDWLRNGFPTDEDKKIYGDELKFAPRICKAILDAMEEIKQDQLKSGNWDAQNGMLEALKILNKYLGVPLDITIEDIKNMSSTRITHNDNEDEIIREMMHGD